MCLQLCFCPTRDSSSSFPGQENNLMENCHNNNVRDNSPIANTNSSCACPRKRKEHDEEDSVDSCCKSSKSSSPSSLAVHTSVDSLMRNWMMPPEVDKDDDSAWGRAERWTAVQGQRQEVVFQGERGPKKRRSGRSGKTKQIAKKILNLQPLILGAEAELERRVGHPLSRADKLKDETLGSLMRELVQLKKEQKELKEKEKKEIPQTIEEVRKKVESNMTKLRKLAGRPHSLEEMSLVEQEAEKADLVSQLELVEVELGELVTRGDRHSRQPMADLFLRLRTLKKTTRRPSSDSGEFLEDIPEHETIQVVTTTNRNRRVSLDSTGGEEEQEEEEELESEQEEQEEYNKHEEEEQEEVEWHTMNESELIAALKEMKEQKRRLRKVIQEFESRLCLTTGRKISKEDKEPFRPVYKSYKKTKSRIKLVDALLLKYNSFPNII